MGFVDDLLRQARQIAARTGNQGRTKEELARIETNKEIAAAKKKKGSTKKKKNSSKKEEQKKPVTQTRNIDRVQQRFGGGEETAPSSDKKLTLPSVRRYNPLTKAPVEIRQTNEYRGNSGRTKEELDRAGSVQEISKTTPEQWLDINMEGAAARNRRAGAGALLDNTEVDLNNFDFASASSAQKSKTYADTIIQNWDGITDKVTAADSLIRIYGFTDATRGLIEEAFAGASTQDKWRLMQAAEYVTGESYDTQKMQQMLNAAPDRDTAFAENLKEESPTFDRGDVQDSVYRAMVNDAKTYQDQQKLIDRYIEEGHYTKGDAWKFRAADSVSSWWTRIYDAGSMAIAEWLRQGQNEELIGNPKNRFDKWNSAESFGSLAAMVGGDLLYDLFTAAGLPVALLSKIALTPEDVAMIEEKLTGVTAPLHDEIARQQRIYESSDVGAVERFAMDTMGGVIEMIPGILMGVVNPAAGLATFGTGAGGASARQAYEQGASLGDAVKYGLSTGSAEVVIEKLFGGFGFFGKGVVGEIGKKTGMKLITDTTKKVLEDSGFMESMSYRILKRVTAAGGEATEEMIMEIVTPYLERANINPDAANATLADIGYAGGLGAAIGAILGIPVMVAEGANEANIRKSYSEIMDDARKDMFAKLDMAVASGEMTEEEAAATRAEAEDILAGKGSLNVTDTQEEVKISGEALDTVYDSYEEAKQAMMKETRTKKDGEKITANYIEDGEVKTFTTTAKGGALGLGRSGLAAPKYQKIAKAKNITERSGYQLGVKEDIIKEVSALSTAIGKEVIFDYDARAALHGGVSEREGKIYVNVNSTQSPARAVIAHEMTHLLEGTSSYGKLYELMKKHYGSSWGSKLAEIKANYAAQGKPLNRKINGYDEAETELMAMFVEEKLLTDEAVVREIVQTDKTVAQKIIDWLNKVIQKMVGNKEQKVFAEARDLWNKALQEEKDGLVKERTEEFIAEDAGAEVRQSIGKNDNLMKNAIKRNKTTKAVSESVLEVAKAARKTIKEKYQELFIADSMSAKKKSPLVGNDSYSGSLDNTTICTRSLTMESIVELVAKKIGRPLRNEESIIVAQEMMNYTGDQAECLYCYQANAKRGFEDALANFADQRRTVIENHRNGMDEDTNYKLMMDYNFEKGIWGKKPTDTAKERFDTFIKIAENKIPMAGALYFANTRVLNENIEDPKVPKVIKDQLKQAKKYAQGAVKAHGRVYYAVYNGQILRVKEEKIKEWNNTYGLRMYSFSDFSPAFILENMQMITDASVRGLKMLAYTKEAEFVEIFGGTGMAINISVAGVSDGQGSYHSDGMQGMNWESAKALRDKYPAVGTVYVAKDDAEVEWAMEQEWIDTVIPFHISYGSGMMQRSMGWKNYSGQQSEKKMPGWDGEKGDKKTIYPSAHQNDRETYLRMCEENKLTPKFPQFLKDKNGNDNPNYMKLVNETRLAPKKMNAVQPVFDMEAAEATLEQFAKNGGYNPILGGTQENREYIAEEITEKVKTRAPELKARDDMRYSISSKFVRNVEKWDRDGRPGNRRLFVGTVSDALKSIGIGENMDSEPNIFWHTAKLKKIMEDHPEIKLDTIKTLTNVLENPVIILENPKKVNRIVMFGEVYGTNEIPVMVVLELSRKEKNDLLIDEMFVVNSYTRERKETYGVETTSKNRGKDDTQYIINNYRLLYTDPNENRTREWMAVNRLQLPLGFTQYGSVGKISYIEKDVKGRIVAEDEAPAKTAMQIEMERAMSAKNTRNSIGASKDEEYLKAVESDDMGTAERIIREAAVAAGYDSPKLYHGTKSFGFTELRTEDLDIFAWSPFFTTSDPKLAETYSGKTERRQIKGGYPKASQEQIDDYLAEHRTVLKKRIRAIDNHLSKTTLPRTNDAKRKALMRDAKDELMKMVEAQDSAILSAAYNSYMDAVDALEKTALFPAEEKLFEFDELHNARWEIGRIIGAEEVFVDSEGKLVTYENREEIESDTAGIYSFYANLDDLLDIDGEGKNWNHIEGSKIGRSGDVKTRDVALYAKENGYKGVIIRNITDSGGQTDYYEPGDIYIFFDPAAQVKSADPVTYDDNGDIIPPSERFNEENKDIRWSVGSYKAKYKKGDKFHWLGEAVTVEKIIKEKGVPDTYILKYKDGSTDAVKGDELMSDEDVEKYNAKKGNAVFGEDVIEYYVGEYVSLGFGERGIIADKFRMSDSEYAYTVNLENGEVMNYVSSDDIVPKMRNIKHINDGYVPQKTEEQVKTAKSYLVGDIVSYLGERAAVVERNHPKGGELSYTIELENGDRLVVGADELEVGVTPQMRFDELPDETQEAWHDVPDDWDGSYDDAYDDLEDWEPPKSTDKTNPLELDEVRHMISDYADMLSDPTAEELEFEWAWTKALTGKGVSFLKDYVRNIEAAANGNKGLEQRLRKLFVDPFRKGKTEYVRGVHSMLDELYDKMEELGIKKNSTEAAAVIKYGEKKKVEWVFGYNKESRRKLWQTIVTPYDIEDLKKECPDTWENVVEADRWFRDKYDSYLVRINEVRREIYGHHFKHREMEISTAREKAAYHKETRNGLQAQLDDIEQCLRAKRARVAVKRNAQDPDVYELEKEIDYNNEYRNTIVNLIAEHKEKELHYKTIANELEDDLLHGQSWNQKRLKARHDYYHHMREESGFLEDLFLNGRNSEIDPTLEGKSFGTKPKAKWSGIFERQGVDPFRYDAVAAFIDYIQAAEYAIHMDPVISQFRANIYNMASATQKSKNANKLILWLTNWTNDLSGKTTDHVDRWVQERIGRDNMRRIRKIVGRSKFNAVGINLNSAVAQFGNLPNALAYVQNPQSWGKGLQLYMKWLTKDDAARRIVKESTFLDERFLDTVMSKFDQRLKDKPEKFAAWMLRFGDQHSSFMIWCVAYEEAVRKGLKRPVAYADEITMESVAGRGVGEIPLQMRSTWTQIVAPFQIEVNNAYQIYKKKMKTITSKKAAKDERINAGTSFLLLLLGNFVMNTISDLLTHRRILFDPIFVLLETIGEWADEDDKPEEEQTNWWEKFRDLIGREIGNIFSNMPYGDLIAYYVFNNEWAREKLFGNYDPTRFGVGNIALDWAAGFATDLVTGGDLADDILGFITTFATPFGGKQAERIIKGLVQAGWLPDVDISTGELPSVKFQKAPGVYNSKDQLQFPVPTLADDPLQALMAIIFGAYTTEYGEKYLGKDRSGHKWWENILGWNKVKEQTALSARATEVYNALVANGADQFAVYDTLREVQAADKTVDKRNALLDKIYAGDITEEDAVNILLGYMTSANNVDSVNEKLTAFTDAGLTVTDYLEVANLYTAIDNSEEYGTAQDKANAFVTDLLTAGYTSEQIQDINNVMKYFSHIPANIDKFSEMTASGLTGETAVQVQNALAALEPLDGKKQVTETQKAEAIANLNLSEEDERKAMSMALSSETYVKYQAVADYGVDASVWVDYKNALADADANNEDEKKRNGSYDGEEKKAALNSLNVSNETRAALWQIMDNKLYSTDKDTSWKAARNPYSSSVGAKVVDACNESRAAMEAEKESAETESAYSSPLSGELVINSEYGYRVHPISGKWKMHSGVDLDGEQGDPVLAAADGKVVKVVHSNTGYGNYVVIEHEDGTQTLYAHMYSYGVEEGQTVTKGEQIGEVGSTGASTGNHLHFEVRVDGQAVNPQTVFDFTGEGIVTEADPNYAPIVSGGGSSGGSSSGRSGSSSGRSGGSNSSSRVASVSSNRSGGSGLTLPSVGTSSKPTGRSTNTPTYGAMGLTLPRVPQRDTSIAYNKRGTSTQRTSRTDGKGFWDPDILA